jgi:hypothetical protein
MAHEASKAEPMIGGGMKVSADRSERRPARKKISRISVERAKNGGHAVEHHYISGPEHAFEPSTTHVFGKGDGHKLLQHLTRHLGVDVTGPAPGAGNSMAKAARAAEGE